MSVSIGDLIATLSLDDRLTKGLTAAGDKMTSFGTAMLPISVGIAAIGGVSITMAATFEQSLTKMNTLAGVSKEEMKGVKAHILALAPAVGIGPQKLAEAMMLISSTTSDTKVALEILDEAARASAAGLGETADIGKALTAIINSYGSENITAAKAVDILTTTVKLGGAEATELAPVLANIIPLAAQMGISFEQVGAHIATVTQLGTPASEAVTQLSATLVASIKPTKEGIESLAQLGLSYEQLRVMMGKDLQGTLAMLNEKFKGNSAGLAEVFGRIEGLRGMMAVSGAQAEAYAKNIAATTKAAGSAGAAYKAMEGTTAHTWAQMRSQLEAVAIALGDRLAPSFSKAMEAAKPLGKLLADLVDGFGKLDPALQTGTIAVAGFFALLGPGLIALGMVVKSVGAMAGAFSVAVKGVVLMSNTVPIMTARIWLMEASLAAGTTSLGALGLAVATFAASYVLADWFMKHTELGNAYGKMLDAQLQIMLNFFGVSNHQIAKGTDVTKSWTAAQQAQHKAVQAAIVSIKAGEAVYASEGSAISASTLALLQRSLALKAGSTAYTGMGSAAAASAVGTSKFSEANSAAVEKLTGIGTLLGTVKPVLEADTTAKLAGGKAAEKLGTATQDVGEKLGKAGEGAKGFAAASNEAAEKVRLHEESVRALILALQGMPVPEEVTALLEALEKIGDASKIDADQVEGLAAQLQNAAKSGAKLTPVAQAVVDRWEKMKNVNISLRNADELLREQTRIANALRPSVSNITLEYIELGESIKAATGKTNGFAKLTDSELEGVVTKLRAMYQALQAYGKENEGLTDSMIAAYRELQARLNTITPTVKTAVTSTEKWNVALALSSKLANAVGGSLGKWIDIAGSIGQSFQKWKADLKEIGENTKLSEQEKEAAKLASTMSAVASAVGMVASAMRDGSGSTIDMTAAIIEGAMAGAEMGSIFGPWGALIGAVAGGIAAYAAASAEIQKEMNKMVGTLTDAAKGMYTLGDGMNELKQQAKEAGISLDKVFDAKDLNQLAKAVEDTKVQFAAWDHLIDTMGGSLDSLLFTAAEAGVSLDALFNAQSPKAYLKEIQLIQYTLELWNSANSKLQVAIDKYGISIEQLGPKFAQQAMDKQALQLIEDWGLLAAAGVGVTVLIDKMGPGINEFVQQSIRAGTAIPEAMRPMIEQMILEGKLLDENGRAFGSVEEAGLSFAKTMTQQFETLLDAIEDLVRVLSGLKPIHIPITYDYPNEPTPPSDDRSGDRSIPEFGTGGVVTSPTLAVVGEKGPEAIVPLDRMGMMGSSGPVEMSPESLSAMQRMISRSVRDALLQSQ